MPAVLRISVVPVGLLALSLACSSGCKSDEGSAPDDEVKRDGGREARDAGSGETPDDARARPPDADAPRKDADSAGEERDAEVEPDAESDAGEAGCVEFTMPSDVDCSPPAGAALPRDLRCTGLYGDFDGREPACGVLEYKPAMELWSDGAAKRRWVTLPEGTKVDVSDPNEFVYPAGTKFWKEFRVEGEDGTLRLAETRLLEKTPDGWLRTSYVWSEDEREAIQMDNAVGVANLYGTGHTVPNRDQCGECHGGRKDEILGWDALMLGSGASGLPREKLAELGLLEGELPALSIPGDEDEQAALGYLHANCGISCHNDNPLAKAKDTGLYLRLEAGELDSVQTTDAFTTSMNKRPAENAKYEGLENQDPMHWYAIRPGDPERSLLVARQTIRGTEAQMPRIGTNQVDDEGVAAVTRWIEAMTAENGYPEPDP